MLELRESGLELDRQAVLFRASHHSLALELELGRRDVPFRKFGGLRFLETAHVKDLLAFLRLAENPRDEVSGLRCLLLLPGVGRSRAAESLASLRESAGDFDAAWGDKPAPRGGAGEWRAFVSLMDSLAAGRDDLSSQVRRVRNLYRPLMEASYDNAAERNRDLEQIELLAGRGRDRASFLADLTLDPPSSTLDAAGPKDDEECLTLSTMHSAKGFGVRGGLRAERLRGRHSEQQRRGRRRDRGGAPAVLRRADAGQDAPDGLPPAHPAPQAAGAAGRVRVQRADAVPHARGAGRLRSSGGERGGGGRRPRAADGDGLGGGRAGGDPRAAGVRRAAARGRSVPGGGGDLLGSRSPDPPRRTAPVSIAAASFLAAATCQVCVAQSDAAGGSKPIRPYRGRTVTVVTEMPAEKAARVVRAADDAVAAGARLYGVRRIPPIALYVFEDASAWPIQNIEPAARAVLLGRSSAYLSYANSKSVGGGWIVAGVVFDQEVREFRGARVVVAADQGPDAQAVWALAGATLKDPPSWYVNGTKKLAQRAQPRSERRANQPTTNCGSSRPATGPRCGRSSATARTRTTRGRPTSGGGGRSVTPPPSTRTSRTASP